MHQYLTARHERPDDLWKFYSSTSTTLWPHSLLPDTGLNSDAAPQLECLFGQESIAVKVRAHAHKPSWGCVQRAAARGTLIILNLLRHP